MITAIVVNWNGKHYLEECLVALQAQEPPPAEIVVVDNHSDDGSRAWLAERHPELEVVDTGRNGGPGLARNVGLRRAAHDRVLLVDNDVVLRPGALASLERALDADPAAAAVQARALCHDDPGVVHYGRADLHYLGLLVLDEFFTPRRPVRRARAEDAKETTAAGALPSARPPVATGADPGRGRGERRAAPPSANAAALAPVAVAAAGAAVSLCLLVDRPRALAVGGFREELFFYFEDTDFSWRLRLAGHRVLHDPGAEVRHRGGTADLSLRAGRRVPAARIRWHSRNRMAIELANLRLRTLLLTAPGQAAYELAQAGAALAGGHVLPWLRGKLELVVLLPAILRWRRQVAATRTERDRDLLVAAPLTVHPGLADQGAKAALRRALDRFLHTWWRLVRPLCG